MSEPSELEALRAQLDANLGLTPKAKPKRAIKPVGGHVFPTLVVAEPAVPAKKVKKQRLIQHNVNRPDFDQLVKKYPHAKAGTLCYSAAAKKWTVEITCAKCGATRTVHTSDLFQVKLCTACKGSQPHKQAASEAEKVRNIKILAKEILGEKERS